MAAKNKASLTADNITTFPSGTGNILAADEVIFNKDVIDSYLNNQETADQTMSGNLDLQGNALLNASNIGPNVSINEDNGAIIMDENVTAQGLVLNVPEKLENWTSNALNENMTPDFTTGEITIDNSGVFLVGFNSFGTFSVNNSTIAMSISINGTPSTLNDLAGVSNSDNLHFNLGTSSPISLTSGDVISVSVVATASGDLNSQDSRLWAVRCSQADLPTQVLQQLSRSIYAGWHVASIPSINSGDNHQFDLTPGEGQFVDFSNPENVVTTPFSYAGATGIVGTLLGSSSIVQTFITINDSGTVVQRGTAPSATQAENELFIGNMTHADDVGNNDIFSNATSTPFSDYSLDRTFREFLRIFGGINIQGLSYSGVSGTLSIQHTDGVGLGMGRNYTTNVAFPDTPTALAENPVPAIVQTFEDLNGDLMASPVNAFVDAEQYKDVPTGALVAMPNNQYQIKRIFFFYNSNTTIMYYGNNTYSNLAAAQNGIVTELFNEHRDTKEAVFRGYLLVKKGTTNLTIAADAEFRTSGGFRPTGSAQGLTTVIDLQDAYNNDPNIITNPSNGPLDITVGSGSDGDPILRGFNSSPTEKFSLTGAGNIFANAIHVEEVIAQDTGNNALSSLIVQNTSGAEVITGKGNGDFTAVRFFGDISNTTGAPASSITQFFSQRRNSTQSLSIALPVVIIPNVANTTSRGAVLNTATGVTTITSTTEGVYNFNFTADISINNSVTDAIFLVVIRVNGTDRVRQNFIQPFTVGVFPVSIGGYFDLVDTDTVDITIRNGSDQIASVQNSGFLYNVVRISS